MKDNPSCKKEISLVVVCDISNCIVWRLRDLPWEVHSVNNPNARAFHRTDTISRRFQIGPPALLLYVTFQIALIEGCASSHERCIRPTTQMRELSTGQIPPLPIPDWAPILLLSNKDNPSCARRILKRYVLTVWCCNNFLHPQSSIGFQVVQT